MTGTQTISPSNPVVYFPWESDSPVNVRFSIYGHSGLGGYMPPSVAFVEYYDPYSNEVIAEAIPVGGTFGPSDITIITGSLVNLGVGEVKIRVIDNTELPFGVFDEGGKFIPKLLHKILQAYGVIDDAISGVSGTNVYNVSQLSIENTTEFVLNPNATYAPGFLESKGLNPNNLPDGLEPIYDHDGNFIAVKDKQLCFAAGTMITMADGSEKPIEQIRPGDMVMAFDADAGQGRGALRPSRVVRTFTNQNQLVIDFHGTKVTPGHAYLCGDGPHVGRFRPIMDIIRDDGAVVDKDGRLIRAATNCAVGSRGDAFVEFQIVRNMRLKATGQMVEVIMERGRVRAGTRLIGENGKSYSLLEMIDAAGWKLLADGLVEQVAGRKPEPLTSMGPSVPKPEDYVLALSKLTLADLYDEPRTVVAPAAPGSLPASGGERLSERAAFPSPSGAPKLSREQRRRLQAEERRAAKARKHAGMSVH